MNKAAVVTTRQRLFKIVIILTPPVPPGTPLSPRVAVALAPSAGVYSAALRAGFAVQYSALSIGAAVLMRCGVLISGNRLAPGHSCRLRSFFRLFCS